ncbi:asparagine synthase-related protein [Sphingomonas oligoaromativorans]|uniref:asparagine synthase-related protein n=1 Tax=Sphingomonas oligoaromativorans TaxID=575322 RepID=UPI001421C7E6|nr:asparagine synthase-related protein [Sphingomonas oligoaromativorans]NIJ33722.1 asparagine synthase (glutamine-hydrolysing) [Sphingomonas oligoaromativorans]
MSGIFGVVRWDGRPVSPREIERMGNTLAHRGRDGRRISVHGSAGLGHALMRVHREDVFEAQPLHDPAMDVELVADARIDNREDLAQRIGIAPEVLAEMSDSALLLAAYRHWGEACAEHLLGDFAFAVWNRRTRSLLLARDHMGQRGLYYHHGDGFLAFASEPKALWAVEGVPRRLLEREIGRRLLQAVDHVPGVTLYDGIAILPGGETAQLDGQGALHRRRYWEMQPAPQHLEQDEQYYIETYRRLMEEVVGCRVRRLIHAPGLLFSGGFDSGIVAAMAGPIVAAQGRRIVAVSSVLAKGERRATRDARAAVEAFSAFPYMDVRYFVRRDETAFSHIETAFAQSDDMGGTSYVRRELFDRVASSGVRLVLDGMGGDYTINVRAGAMLGRILRRGHIGRFVREYRARRRATGRSRVQIWRDDVLLALIPLPLIGALHSGRNGFRPLWKTKPVDRDFARSLFRRGEIDPSRLRRAGHARTRWEARWREFLASNAAAEPVQSLLAAARGLDFSRPYHDKRVVEFALALPEALHFRNGLERYLAREAFRDCLPERLLASGPGNDSLDPDMYRMAMASAPDALAEARSLDRGGRLSRYLDFGTLEKMLAGTREEKMRDHARLSFAIRALICARFVAWFEASNA